MEMQQLLLAPDNNARGEHRACFICLEDDEELVSCCTRCYGAAHSRCWKEWRANQRSSALRVRQAGGGAGSSLATRDPFLCTICKSGRARLVGEVVNREWIETVLGAVLSAGRSRGDNAGSETDMFEDAENPDGGDSFPCCSRRVLCVNLCVLLSVGFVGVLVDYFALLSTGSVILMAFLLLSQWIVFLTAWAVAERRRLWRQHHRPLTALINDELTHRSGRLFPTDVHLVN